MNDPFPPKPPYREWFRVWLMENQEEEISLYRLKRVLECAGHRILESIDARGYLQVGILSEQPQQDLQVLMRKAFVKGYFVPEDYCT